MNVLSARFHDSLGWLLAVVVLVVLIGWEIDWGTAVRVRPPPPEPVAPTPVTPGLLPDYVIAGGVAAHAETVNRTLFNPTRRPAPVAVAEGAKPQIQRGQFQLTGTTVAGDRSLAFLKETNGGKPRTVKQGETINGMVVAMVTPDRVKLTLGDESEEIVLKVATNPKSTPQPAAAPPRPGQPPGTPSPIAPAAQQQPVAGGGQNAGQALAERRRAAREAATAAATTQQEPGGATATPAAGTPAGADPRWQQQREAYARRAAATRAK